MVLIVDDDEESRVTTARLVASFGARVQTARDGEEALAMVHAAPPDLILCDLAMPNMNGVDLVTALRAAPSLPRIPVIAVTGLATPGAVLETWKTGFDGHVVKPMTASVLARLLERVAPGRRRESSSR
jgi:CheY-like chemotaxis protein